MSFHMIEHIYESPEALRRTLDKEGQNVEKVAKGIRKKEADALLVTGCGASYHDALSARPALEKLTHLPTLALPASEVAYLSPGFLDEEKVVIVISRSGEKGDALSAARKAQKAGARVVALTATPDSLLAQKAQEIILTHEGAEFSQPKTKSFISILGILLQLAIHLSDLGSEEKDKLVSALSSMPDMIRTTIFDTEEKAKSLAHILNSYDHLYVTGTSYNLGTVSEAALKLKETCRIHAEGYALGEVTQGPLLLLDQSWGLLSFLTPENLDLALPILATARKQGSLVISVSPALSGVAELSHYHFTIPPVADEMFSPLTYIVPVQLLAYYIALEKELDPDNPPGFDAVLELILEPGRREPEMR